MNMYIHEMASFAFTGFESTIANFQVGYIGAVLTVAELVSVKPSTMSRVTGLNSLTI
jgi:mannitol-specific phosphotransferase system IIBC component